MNENQIRAYLFNNILLLTGLVDDYSTIKSIFNLGQLSFEPSDSQINNWRKYKIGSSIFKEEYMRCFIDGMYIYKREKEKENISVFNFKGFHL